MMFSLMLKEIMFFFMTAILFNKTPMHSRSMTNSSTIYRFSFDGCFNNNNNDINNNNNNNNTVYARLKMYVA